MIELHDPRLPQRFWSYVKADESGCWRWTGPRSGGGYGRWCHERKARQAHRFAYERLVAPDLQGVDRMTYPKMKPCPKCGNIYTELYGYGDWGTTWHVECDECHYMGPGGNKLQAIREHNELFEAKNPQFGEQAA